MKLHLKILSGVPCNILALSLGLITLGQMWTEAFLTITESSFDSVDNFLILKGVLLGFRIVGAVLSMLFISVYTMKSYYFPATFWKDLSTASGR